MKTHTPGPWFVVPDPQWEGKHPNHASRCICNVPQFAEVHPPTEGENGEWHVFHDQHGKTVCLMTDTLEITANATLIASAPDLLAVLQQIADDVEAWSDSGDSELFHARMHANAEDARFAISKAKGNL
jgi:hypothetical protein